MMWGLGGWGALWMALFWVSVVLLVVWTVKPPAASDRTRRSAAEILEARYARGEIEAEEFLSRRKNLERV